MEEQPLSEKQEVITEVVGFDIRKLWTTVKELTLRPGSAIADYCNGKRQSLISPITYFLLTSGLNYFLTKISGMMEFYPKNGKMVQAAGENGYVQFFQMGYKMGSPTATDEQVLEAIELIKPGIDFISSKEGMMLTTLPILVVLQWLFFRKYRKSFLHNLFFLLFITAQINLLTIPLIFIPALFPSLLTLVFIGIIIFTMVFYFRAMPTFYTNITTDQIILRTIGQFAVGLVPFIIWFCIVFVGAIFIYHKFLN